MKTTIVFFFSLICLASCTTQSSKTSPLPIQGTWKLLTGTLIENGDTSITDYTHNTSFIKIINDTHFGFFQHNLTKTADSTNGFSAGGGRYTLNDSTYTEYLEYCSAPQWENNSFPFTISIQNDTLISRGIEKVEKAGVNRINIEKYVRLTNK